MSKKRILFLVPYPVGESPSQRFRFEQYFELLDLHGFQYNVQSFLDIENWQVFYKQGATADKVRALLAGFGRRIIALFKASHYDYIFIHREVAPLGPPVFEWVLVKILQKKIIYDFDDAIWLTDRSEESMIMRIGKWRGKVKSILKWSYTVSCGNDYLTKYAKTYNEKVIHNPTTIDTQYWHNPDLHRVQPTSNNYVTIGWTGSHSTLKYLRSIELILRKLEIEYPSIQTVIIADRKPDLNLDRLIYIPWKKQTEIEDLLRLDIGIMPLTDDEWSQGKCGFKALQYMALKIPTVASPVGVNRTIIDDLQDGFLCTSEEEWESVLRNLILQQGLREKIGENGRRKVIGHYSVNSNSSNFLSLFK